MARKPTKDQQIAALEARVKSTEEKGIDAMRERDDARDMLGKLTIGAKGDAVQRLRLAVLAYPQDDPKSIGWDDLVLYFGQHSGDMERIKRAIKAVAEEHGISADVDSVDGTDAAIDAFNDSLKEYREAIQTIAEACEVDHGGPDDVAEELEKKVAGEGFGSKVREDAIELLRELGYDVKVLLDNLGGAESGKILPLDDPHVVYTLRNQVRR
jgi:hypothetical protein